MQAVQHLEIRTTRGGESKAFIAGTRISVQNIYVCHELQRLSPDEIAAAYPQLTLAQIHSALAYYYDHAEEIREQLRREESLAELSRGAHEPTRFELLRQEVLNKQGPHGDSLSSR